MHLWPFPGTVSEKQQIMKTLLTLRTFLGIWHDDIAISFHKLNNKRVYHDSWMYWHTNEYYREVQESSLANKGKKVLKKQF